MIFFDKLHEYSQEMSSPQSDLLHLIERQSHLKTLQPRMISGRLQGRFLSLISKLLSPHRILEIGTFTGYATLCMAEGLKAEGKIITLEANDELEPMTRGFFEKSEYSERIDLRIGDALEILPTLDEKFDLVFIDAKKRDYPLYFDLIIDKMNQGGLILSDNILWSGKVLNEKKDKTTQVIHEYNQKILDDPRVENVLLPLRDGLNIARKL